MAFGGSTVKADKLMAEADKKANKFDWFGINKAQNQENAAELYVRAAAQYKIAKDYANAGLCYTKAAKCNMAAQNDIEAKSAWREAGKCYRHVDYKAAIDAYKNAIQLQLDADRFGQAARLEEEIGDMLRDDEHYDEAIAAYEQSADYYEAENDTGNRNKRLLKVAHMCGKAKKWEKAIKIFERIAKDSVDNNLLRWKVKEYVFKAMLLNICMLCEDDILGRKKVKWPQAKVINERYCDISDIYATSRECKLINTIIDCLENLEILEFKDAVAAHDKIVKIEAWIFELIYYMEKYMKDSQHAAPNLDDGFDDDDDNNNNNDYDNDDQKANNYNDKPVQPPQNNPFDQVPPDDDAPDPDML